MPSDYEKQAENWLRANTTLQPQSYDIKSLAAEYERIARDARAEERERCAQAVCLFCRYAAQVELLPADFTSVGRSEGSRGCLKHKTVMLGGHTYYSECRASAIRAAGETEKGAKVSERPVLTGGPNDRFLEGGST